MMKEFRFEPASQMITVEEGQNLSIDITGIKTAYRYLKKHVRYVLQSGSTWVLSVITVSLLSSPAATEQCSLWVGTQRGTWPWRRWDRESVASTVRTLSPTRRVASDSGVCWWVHSEQTGGFKSKMITCCSSLSCRRSLGKVATSTSF